MVLQQGVEQGLRCRPISSDLLPLSTQVNFLSRCRGTWFKTRIPAHLCHQMGLAAVARIIHWSTNKKSMFSKGYFQDCDSDLFTQINFSGGWTLKTTLNRTCRTPSSAILSIRTGHNARPSRMDRWPLCLVTLCRIGKRVCCWRAVNPSNYWRIPLPPQRTPANPPAA